MKEICKTCIPQRQTWIAP